MGVKSCHRGDCRNVMCDRYSSEYGYICGDCFKELVAFKPKNHKEIEMFMDSTTGEFNHFANYTELLDKVFPLDESEVYNATF